MQRKVFAIALLLTAAACAEEPPEAEASPDPKAVERFLAERDPPQDALIERRVDLEQASNLVAKAPPEQTSAIARSAARN